MQRMYDYATSRTPISLESMEQVAKNAALETIKKLGAKHLTTCECPVIFRKELARGLFGSFVSAITGSNLYRKSSFLLDHLGKQVFSSHVSMKEDPHIMQGIGSTSFDSEGVRTVPRELVADGILNGYVLGSYSARKLSMKTTGNAGGIHNLLVHTEKELTFEELLKTMNTGLLVTELMGDGINIVTGNYSRGAFGYWVENGEIKYPVEGITIASNLKDMFLHIVAISNDVDKRGVIQTGSVLIDKMKVAGI
jgi:PmbA protein